MYLNLRRIDPFPSGEGVPPNPPGFPGELAEKNAEEVKNQKEEMKNNIKKPLTREQAYKLEEKERQDNLRRQKRKMFKIMKN